MTEIQSQIGLNELARCDDWNMARRKKYAAMYCLLYTSVRGACNRIIFNGNAVLDSDLDSLYISDRYSGGNALLVGQGPVIAVISQAQAQFSRWDNSGSICDHPANLVQRG